jgi:hypothetical protein
MTRNPAPGIAAKTPQALQELRSCSGKPAWRPHIYCAVFCMLIFSFAEMHAQGDYADGYRYLHKAEKLYSEGRFSKASQYLEKAKKCDYGFCGNAWMDAEMSIGFLEARIFIAEEKYHEALNILDSLTYVGMFGIYKPVDSLKVYTLVKKFGREKVKENFSRINTVQRNEFNVACIDLSDLDYHFCFYSGAKLSDQSENEFYELAKDQPFYRLLE